MVNGLRLYRAFIASGHSTSPHIHPFMHTFIHRRSVSHAGRQTASCLAQGHLLHTQLGGARRRRRRRSRGSNQQPPGYQPTPLYLLEPHVAVAAAAAAAAAASDPPDVGLPVAVQAGHAHLLRPHPLPLLLPRGVRRVHGAVRPWETHVSLAVSPPSSAPLRLVDPPPAASPPSEPQAVFSVCVCVCVCAFLVYILTKWGLQCVITPTNWGLQTDQTP